MDAKTQIQIGNKFTLTSTILVRYWRGPFTTINLALQCVVLFYTDVGEIIFKHTKEYTKWTKNCGCKGKCI